MKKNKERPSLYKRWGLFGSYRMTLRVGDVDIVRCRNCKIDDFTW